MNLSIAMCASIDRQWRIVFLPKLRRSQKCDFIYPRTKIPHSITKSPVDKNSTMRTSSIYFTKVGDFSFCNWVVFKSHEWGNDSKFSSTSRIRKRKTSLTNPWNSLRKKSNIFFWSYASKDDQYFQEDTQLINTSFHFAKHPMKIMRLSYHLKIYMLLDPWCYALLTIVKSQYVESDLRAMKSLDEIHIHASNPR